MTKLTVHKKGKGSTIRRRGIKIRITFIIGMKIEIRTRKNIIITEIVMSIIIMIIM